MAKEKKAKEEVEEKKAKAKKEKPEKPKKAEEKTKDKKGKAEKGKPDKKQPKGKAAKGDSKADKKQPKEKKEKIKITNESLKDWIMDVLINGRDLRPESMKKKKPAVEAIDYEAIEAEQKRLIAEAKAESEAAEAARKKKLEEEAAYLVIPVEKKAVEIPESEEGSQLTKEFVSHKECVNNLKERQDLINMLKGFDEMDMIKQREITNELISRKGAARERAREAMCNETGRLLESIHFRGSLHADELLDIILTDPHPAVRLAAAECTLKFIEGVAKKGYEESPDEAVKARLKEIYHELTGETLEDKE